MNGSAAMRVVDAGSASAILFDSIGAFLAEQGLSPDPHHYAFAYGVITDPNGPLYNVVSNLTEGGVRLSSHDIETLGGEIGDTRVPDLPPMARRTPAPCGERASADGLIAQTQHQVEGFADMMRAMRSETQGFGRDLAASADAIRGAGSGVGIDEVVRLTGAMLTRVYSAEARLETATHEASELRAKLEEARENARRDPLTELPNRRAFEEAFASHAASVTPMCVAVCDIDRFKRVNDQFGHAVGDRVLKAIGATLGQACAGHLVARYGGEEFVVLFTGVDRDAALATLEAARGTVAAKRYRLRETEMPLGAVTFSAGLSQAAPGETLETVFARADALLYAAKAAGRNQLETD